MRYISTRGGAEPLAFSDAVAMGLAPDGGLYLPEKLPDLSAELAKWEGLDYVALSTAFFSHFATDIPQAELHELMERSYSGFRNAKVAPLVTLAPDLHVLELFHGPTLAFKDFALQLLGNLYERQIARSGQPIQVLGATSGDTGAAAIHGLLGKEGVQIFILYPDGGVAPLQERQMACTGVDNVHALAIRGSFDDAQNAIKEIFGDLEFRRKHRLSAVNSINLARVLAQCVYYIAAWFQLPPDRRANVEFVVPTGNFGNVLAGWMVQKMGLPVKGFRIATNQNDILYRLFTTGEYRVDKVLPSVAPSMDIQIASNFERFLYFHENCDPVRVCEVMKVFRASGSFVFPDFDRDTFSASRADDGDIQRIIGEVYSQYNYIVDPHTACGFAGKGEGRTQIVLATAHPAKFPDTIVRAIGVHPTEPSLEALKVCEIRKEVISPDVQSVRSVIERYSK